MKSLPEMMVRGFNHGANDPVLEVFSSISPVVKGTEPPRGQTPEGGQIAGSPKQSGKQPGGGGRAVLPTMAARQRYCAPAADGNPGASDEDPQTIPAWLWWRCSGWWPS
jgi:hypothetical protein